jgi:hypothetical protein
MREADLLVHRLPPQLREPMRLAGRRLGVSQSEVESVVDQLVRTLIQEGFGDDPERVIVEALIVRRRERDDQALGEVVEERRPQIRRVS